MQFDRARDEDFPAIEALLSSEGLPLDGAAQAFELGFVARDDYELVGAAAAEVYGSDALLRSVVVADRRRGAGLAARLVSEVEALARSGGVRDVYLLTETAAEYFPRLGYVVIDREAVPRSVTGSVEFTGACGTTAVAMVHHLPSRRPSP